MQNIRTILRVIDAGALPKDANMRPHHEWINRSGLQLWYFTLSDGVN